MKLIHCYASIWTKTKTELEENLIIETGKEEGEAERMKFDVYTTMNDAKA